MKLNLGSGFEPRAGWVNLDLNPSAPAEIHGPAFPLDLPDASVEEIRAVDVLEHLSYRDTDRALAEWARVLRPEGRLYVQVPDAARVLAWWATGAYDDLVNRLPADLVTGDLKRDAWTGVQWRLLGGHADGVSVHDGDDWRLNAHYSLWTEGSLTMALGCAGFEVESWTINIHPNHQVLARRL